MDISTFPSLTKRAGLALVGGLVAASCFAQQEKTPGSERPNILFALADDWGYGHAGVFGCKWVDTPSFDKVAKQGLLFTNAYTPVAKCAPSRAAILTGRNPWQLEAAANHFGFFPPKFLTYADALAKHGYFVGMTGKGWAPGVAKDADGKKRFLAGTPFDERKLTPPTSEISDNDYTANFEDFLNAAPQGEPWCFWYGSNEPHRKYEYGTGVSKGGKDLSAIDRVPGFWPDNEAVRNDMADYAFEVENFDRHLGRMLDVLEKRGQLENTIVVVASDNGIRNGSPASNATIPINSFCCISTAMPATRVMRRNRISPDTGCTAKPSASRRMSRRRKGNL